jgi:hypothetical protein
MSARGTMTGADGRGDDFVTVATAPACRRSLAERSKSAAFRC